MSGNEAGPGCREAEHDRSEVVGGVVGEVVDEVERLSEELRVRRRLLDTVLLPVGAGWAGLPGVVAPTGVLFFGPDAALARPLVGAIATAYGIEATAVDVVELLSDPGVRTPGEVAGAMVRAGGPGPVVIELVGVDLLARRRYLGAEADVDAEQATVGAELLAAGLVELRGDDPRHQPLLVTTTDRPWEIDDALLVRGAFDRSVFVPPPDWGTRRRILAERLGDLDVDGVAALTDGWSAADLGRLLDGLLGGAAGAAGAGVDPAVDLDGLASAVRSTTPEAARWMNRAREMADFASDRRRFDDLIGYLGRYRLS